jgi:Spy/CpxP family protein refolding chaperone
MKKLSLSTAVLAAASMMPVSGLFAQSTVTTPTHTPPSAAQMVANQVSRLTTLLTLTATQQSQATTIFTTEHTAISGLWSSMKTAHTALKTAVEANDVATIGTVSTQIGSLTAQEVQAHGVADAAFYALLTADQQTKYASLRHGGMDGFGMHRGPGGPGF